MGFKTDKRMLEYYQKIKVYCPNCGHSNSMPKWVEIRICSWCGHKVYRTKEIEFKDKLKKAQIKEKKNER